MFRLTLQFSQCGVLIISNRLLITRILFLACGLRTGAVLRQYRANPRPGSNCPVQAFLFVYNCRCTMPFVHTGMNPIFPPGMLKLTKSQYLISIFQLNYTRYHKKLLYKIVYYKNIYEFEWGHFFVRSIFIFLF